MDETPQDSRRRDDGDRKLAKQELESGAAHGGIPAEPASEQPEEARRGNRPGGPAGYEESGGAGLRPRKDEGVIGGGPSGGDEDPVGEAGIPDEAGREPAPPAEEERSRPG